MNTTEIKNLEAITTSFTEATNAALASLGKGKPFIGAFGIADRIGYERKTLEWNCAVSAASQVFKNHKIIVDENNIQV